MRVVPQQSDLEAALASRGKAEQELGTVGQLAKSLSREYEKDQAALARVAQRQAAEEKERADRAARKPPPQRAKAAPANNRAPPLPPAAKPAQQQFYEKAKPPGSEAKPRPSLFDPSFFDSLFKPADKKDEKK